MKPKEAISVRLASMEGWGRSAPTPNLLLLSQWRKTTLTERRAIEAGKILGGSFQPKSQATAKGEEIKGGTAEPQIPDLPSARATLGGKAHLAIAATSIDQYRSTRGGFATLGEVREPRKPLEP